jgi:hypothetical protein
MDTMHTARPGRSRRTRGIRGISGILATAALAAVVSVAGVVFPSAAGAALNDRISGGTWNVRTAPGGAVVGSLRGGQSVTIACQTSGPAVSVRGYGSSAIWDYVTSPVRGYVADLGVSSTSYARFDSRLPRCGGTPAPAPAPATVSSAAQRAANWAIAEKNSRLPYWSDQLRAPWSGWCEVFAEVAYGTRGRMTSAIAHYQLRLRKGQIRTDANPPRGAFVFYGGGNGAGHVGISIGGGQVISTQGFPGQRLPVWQHSVRGISNPYLGWAAFDGSWS